MTGDFLLSYGGDFFVVFCFVQIYIGVVILEKKPFSLWTLFSSTLLLSAFTFGGGYVIVPLMKKKFSDELGWLSEEETLELVAIGQSSPGAIAINTAVLLGYRCGGITGALVGVLGTAIPPLVILSVMFLIYDFVRENVYAAALLRGMQSGISAVIIEAVWDMSSGIRSSRSIPSVVILVAAFCATWIFGVNVAIIIIASGVIGAIMTTHKRSKEGTI